MWCEVGVFSIIYVCFCIFPPEIDSETSKGLHIRGVQSWSWRATILQVLVVSPCSSAGLQVLKKSGKPLIY